jgi:phage prohead protease, HK97 family
MFNPTKTLDLNYIRATDQEIEQRVAPENQGKEGYIAGWASTEAIDSYETIIEAGAFSESLAKRGLTGPQGIKLLLHHDRTKVAGSLTRLEYVGSRLWLEAQLELDIGYVKDTYLAAKASGGLSFSVGFRVFDVDWREIEGRGEVLVVTKGDLIEVSVVTFPANDECIMDDIRNEPEITTISDFEKSLVLQGIAKSRNDAKRVTLAVKRSLHIFGSHKSQEDNETKSNRPMPDEQYAELSKKLDQIRQSVAPEAQT